MQIELQGQVEKITFRSDDTHYTIARLRVSGRPDPVTIVGTLFSVSPGETLRLKGSWEKHPKYGLQFRVEAAETVLPVTAKGIENYLGSGAIKGIGPVMAERLVRKFGTSTIEVIENDIDKLRSVEGFGEKRIALIRQAWSEQKDLRDVMVFLQGHEVSPSLATRIYRHYGRDTLRVIRENPYRLADDVFGIGFLTADRIAGKLGIPRDSLMRCEAGMLYVLGRMADDGHVYAPYDLLIDECMKALDAGREIVLKAFAKLAEARRIVVDEMHEHGLEENNKAVYLADLHAAESGIAGRLKAIATTLPQAGKPATGDAVRFVQADLGIELAQEQVEAVREALHRKTLVITGGPGTGKTTIIRAILRIFRKIGKTVLLAAPTGRAAKRMAESSGYEAKTIHRLLEYSPKNGGFSRNEAHRLDADLVVIDEASMIDTLLMHHLLKAVPDHASLVLVGDVDQLPSVGPGNVLRDVIDSGYVPSVRLREIFRQAGESLIIANAHRINRGEFPVLPKTGDLLQDFYFFEIDDPETAVERVLELCTTKIPERFGLDPRRDIQVMTPMHRGVAGTAHLNELLQTALNPSGAGELARAGRMLRQGDKVMQVRNNYDRDVFNGDIGRIVAIDRENHEVSVGFDERTVAYDFSDLDEIVLAYAISVHKSQGSEYPAVVIPLLTQHYLLLQRNLLYTAVTRGKRLVVIVGTRKALGIAIRNDKPRLRFTRLKERLANSRPA